MQKETYFTLGDRDLAQVILDDTLTNLDFATGEVTTDKVLEALQGPRGADIAGEVMMSYTMSIQIGGSPAAKALERDTGLSATCSVDADLFHAELIPVWQQFANMSPEAQEMYADGVRAWFNDDGQRPVLG